MYSSLVALVRLGTIAMFKIITSDFRNVRVRPPWLLEESTFQYILAVCRDTDMALHKENPVWSRDTLLRKPAV